MSLLSTVSALLHSNQSINTNNSNTNNNNNNNSNSNNNNNNNNNSNSANNLLNDEYLIWKKNTPFLYDVILTNSLEWPSLSCEFYPDVYFPPNKDYSIQRLLIGTNTSTEENNSLQLVEVKLPTQIYGKIQNKIQKNSNFSSFNNFYKNNQNNNNNNNNTNNTNNNNNNNSNNKDNIDVIDDDGDSSKPSDSGIMDFHHGVKVDILQQIPHGPYEIYKSRYSNFNPNLIATRPGGWNEVFLFDRTKHPSKPQDENWFKINKNSSSSSSTDSQPVDVKPDLRFSCHTSDGWGLDWNSLKEGEFVTCGNDKIICLWSIQGVHSQSPKVVEPVHVFNNNNSSLSSSHSIISNTHTEVINDVKFHRFHSALFGSVSDDKKIIIWDTRNKNYAKMITKEQFNENQNNNQNSSAASSSSSSTSSLSYHNGAINSICFSPLSEYLFCTGSSDSSILLWDFRSFKQPIHSLRHHNSDNCEIFNVVFSPHSVDLLMTSGTDKRIYLWDLSRMGEKLNKEDEGEGPPELLFIHGGHRDRINDCCWNPVEGDASFMVASVADDNQLQLWQMAENIYQRPNKNQQNNNN